MKNLHPLPTPSQNVSPNTLEYSQEHLPEHSHSLQTLQSVVAGSIGVFDSGVGGLTTVRKLVNILPNERVLYLGDTARVPYGNKSASTVSGYTRECVDFLVHRSVKLVIIACNTVSAVAMDAARAVSPVPVVGVIEPAAEAALKASRTGRIGIIGTRATVESRAYQTAIQALAQQQGLKREVNVFAEACPLFVPFAEEGWHYHPATRLVAEEYLVHLKQAEVDTLILGCTHYPMLADVIQEVMPAVRLINSGEEAALVAKSILQEQGLASERAPQSRVVECFITDLSTAFPHVAERFLGFPLALAHQVSLSEEGGVFR
jgi:glutamate racemase